MQKFKKMLAATLAALTVLAAAPTYAANTIMVFCKGNHVLFDVNPVEENDVVLVGMRAIFETLGAEVGWEEDTQTATASLDDTTVRLQIDSDVMLVNDEEVALDGPVRLIEDNTMVPMNAFQSVGARVDWIDDLRRIVIDKPEPQVFDDDKGKENWQTGMFGDWQPDPSKYRGGWYEYLESQEETSESQDESSESLQETSE